MITRRRSLQCGAAVVTVAYAWLLAATTSFTTAADVLTAVPLGLAVVAVGIGWRRYRALGPTGTTTVGHPDATTGSWMPWAAVVLVVIGWELYSYLAGSRTAHPTLSSIEDTVAQWQAAKAALVLGWLALGWFLVRP